MCFVASLGYSVCVIALNKKWLQYFCFAAEEKKEEKKEESEESDDDMGFGLFD